MLPKPILLSMILLLPGSPLLADAVVTAEANSDPSTAPKCLNITDIDRTSAPDTEHLRFYMRNGKVWENTLKRSCFGLNYSPWGWVIRGTSSVCANTQQLRVLQTSALCTLGTFAPAN